MPNDVITINALIHELNLLIAKGRIEKISQPEKEELLFTIRASGHTRLIAISVNPNNPRVHLTSAKKDNPYTAFAFLMHLRRHIQNAVIEKITLPTEDRLICIELLSKTELKDENKYYLYVELMGRYSNIILTDSEGYITDALRHFPPSEKSRCILPHTKYVLPANPKISPFDCDTIYQKLKQMSGIPLFDFAAKHLGGMAPSTLLEIIYRSSLTPDITTLFEDEVKEFVSTVKKITNIWDYPNLYSPCLAKSTKGYEDYYIFPYMHDTKNYSAMDTLNKAIDIYSAERDKTEKLTHKSKTIITPLNREIQKTMRQINHAAMKIEDCKNADAYRIYGELITCSLHVIKKGQETATVYNFYEDKNIEIKLDPLKSPVENAQSFFKKYNKLKRTFEIVNVQLMQNNERLEYFLSVKQNLLMSEELSDLEEIKYELEKCGIIKQDIEKNKKTRTIESMPVKYNINGFTVLRGKNNIQNDKLTFKIAKDEDIWLHTKGGHGAHVIISTENKLVPEEVLLKAAELASYFSEFRNSGKAVVDYTARKNVRRHPCNKSGMVIYSLHKSIIVSPLHDENCITE